MLRSLRQFFTLLLFLVVCSAAFAQTLYVAPTDSLVNIDGELAETIWQRAETADNFIQNFPNDTARAYNRTVVRMTYDRHYLYVAVVAYDRNRDKRFVASSLKRDWEWDFNDNFTVYMDSFGDRINGFTFNVTPLGVEREGQLFNGERVAVEWDNKWRSAVRVLDDRWQAELMIPLKTIRYRKNTTYFLMNFARHDLKNNQRTAWRRVPVAYSISALAFADTVRFATPLPDAGPNISIIPYVSGRYLDNRREAGPTLGGGASAFKGGLGFDAKIGLTPSLNLDLTVNPDFSQVEADQQVTNLSRFELFFPERRQFFIENQDLFANFGFEQTRPFFSRRIGISRDTSTGIIVQNPLLYGARLSGKVGKNWRVGLLNTQTATQADRGIDGQNYTVGIVQRQVFGRSNVSGIFVNRARRGLAGLGNTPDSGRFTRIAGLEYNLQTADNRWSGKVFYQKATKPYAIRDAYTHGTTLTYTSRNVEATWLHEYVGQNYQVNDVGYVPRTGYWRFAPELNFTLFVEGERKIVSHGPFIDTRFIRNLDGRLTDREMEMGWFVNARNTAEGGAGYYLYYTYLFFAFDPTNSDGPKLPAGQGYPTRGMFAFYNSDKRRLFNVQLEGYTGGYFNGRNTNLQALVQYRFQPYGSLSVATEYNNIRLPEPYKSARYLLVGPRVDVTFSRKLFWTSVVQINNQTANTLLNTRLQWRYAPVSDLFVVYQENYFPGSLRSKNRALVVKLSYWLNV